MPKMILVTLNAVVNKNVRQFDAIVNLSSFLRQKTAFQIIRMKNRQNVNKSAKNGNPDHSMFFIIATP